MEEHPLAAPRREERSEGVSAGQRRILVYANGGITMEMGYKVNGMTKEEAITSATKKIREIIGWENSYSLSTKEMVPGTVLVTLSKYVSHD